MQRKVSGWIKYPLSLTGKNVSLNSLEKEHLTDLERIAGDQRIWEFYIINCSDSKKFSETYSEAIAERDKGNQFPFVITDTITNEIIGSTRFLDIQPKFKKLEIGWTWIHPGYWNTTINLECKLLLLTYCFETLKTVRVQLRTDEKNLRSRRAIEKAGGKFEGIIRNDMIRENGTKRNSAYYGITDDDWVNLKKSLISKLYL